MARSLLPGCVNVFLASTAIILVCCSTSSQASMTSKSKRSAALFAAEPSIGGSVSGALDAYKDAEDIFFSKIYVEIINYSRWPLSQPEFRITKGVTNQIPSIINPGYKEAFTGQQSLGDDGTEGIAAWDVSDDLFCAFYWKVPPNLAWRKANKMGIGCAAYLDNITDFSEIDNVEFIDYEEFGDSQKTMQHCEDSFCIQGIMSSSHKAEATFNIIPQNEADLAASLKGEINQTMVDRIIANNDSCKLGCGAGTSALPVLPHYPSYWD